MAKESETSQQPGRGLAALQAAVEPAQGRPVHLWDPPFCGHIDMRIARDGTWFYNGTPIGRPALVSLFASVLRRDDVDYVLVTPVEKLGIVVDDAPFVAVEMRVTEGEPGRAIELRTNIGDWVRIDANHPLRTEPGEAEGFKPYVRVRDDLWALVTRALVYDLVALGDVDTIDGIEMFGIASAGSFFPLAPAEVIGSQP